jgi:hypothetical protein
MLPVTCRSVDRTDAAGFAFGALALNSLWGFAAGAAADGAAEGAGFAAAVSVGAGSLILLLENIVCSLDINHWVNSFTTYTYFVVQMDAGNTSRSTYITDTIATRDPLANFCT